MKRSHKTSISLSEDELAILDATASRLKISRSEVARHLIIYQGLCGGDFPLTSQILSLPESSQETVIAEIRQRAEAGLPIKPQAFKMWIQEVLGKVDPNTIRQCAGELLQKLIFESSAKTKATT